MRLLSTGHKDTARDHPHPSFSPDGTRIQIQSAMLDPAGRAMNIAVIAVPESWKAVTSDTAVKPVVPPAASPR
jgi:oligogalacturonide lyase